MAPRLTYKEKLSDPRWDAVRKEVYRRAEYRCQLCGKEGVPLEAHHSYYEPGKMPWEYPLPSLIALCKACHSKAAHGNPDEAIAAAVRAQVEYLEAVTEQAEHLELSYESDKASREVDSDVIKQILASILYRECGGEVVLPLSEISLLSYDYELEQSFDADSYSLKVVGRPAFDGKQAFGIRIASGLDEGDMLDEMVSFAKVLRHESLHQYVKELYYDDKQSLVFISMSDAVEDDTPTARRIFTVAYRHFPMFEWFGTLQGKGELEPERNPED